MNICEIFQKSEQTDLLRFLTCGSVDDGKSTLIGRLLHDSKLVYEDHLAALKRDSERRGSVGGDVDYSLLLDGLKAEREQGITIDVAYRYFSTPRRKFIIADTPGHEQYTRNMATGASTCDLAVILIDARYGVLDQTRRHSFIASLLGIRHLVVAVNKMDLADYSEERFREICSDYSGFAAKLETGDIHFIPISALKGDNVVQQSENMPWFKGASLLEYLETVTVEVDRNLIDLRFPVQYVLRPDLNFRGYSGTIASGVMRKGDAVKVLPSGKTSRIKSLVTGDGEIDRAYAPMAVTVTLEDEIDISRGDMLVHPNNMPSISRSLDAMVVWMHDEPMEKGKQYLVKHTSNLVPGRVNAISYRTNINTLHREGVQRLELNEIGRVALLLNRPVASDPYTKNRGTGCFILIDPLSNATVGAGMITARQQDSGYSAEDMQISQHVERQQGNVTSPMRSQHLQQRPMTIWLTGLPKSGKTTIAYALEKRLFDMGYSCYVLDGQNMRLGVSRNLGFSQRDRAENVRRAAGVARMMNDAGLVVIAAFVSPMQEDRATAREIIGEERFIECYVSTPQELCRQRDNEGLYEKADRGEIPEFSGVSAAYEAPVKPDLVVDHGELSVIDAVELIVGDVQQKLIMEKESI